MLKAMIFVVIIIQNYGARKLFQSDIVRGGGGVISFVPAPTPFRFCQLNLNINSFFQHRSNVANAAYPCFSDKPKITTLMPSIRTPSLGTTSLKTDTVQQEFSMNKQKWLQSNIKQYSYNVRRISPPKTTNEIQIEVCINALTVVPREYEKFNSIDKIFQFVENQFLRSPHNITLQYDSTFGFIKYVSFDKKSVSANEEIGLSVDDFVILSKKQCRT